MEFLTALWAPILLSAVLVFVASSIIWMATPLHKHDYKSPGDKEGPIMDMVRSAALPPGVYSVPWCQPSKGASGDKAAAKAGVAEKLKKGPWAMLIVQPGPPNMGKMLGAWMLHLVIVSACVAYVAHAALAAAPAYLAVFRIAGAAALLAHAGFAMPMCIWHGQPWSQLPGRLVDAVIYSLLTAGAFAGMWPGE